MPFSHVASEYQPEQLAKLTAAFDQAWPRILLTNGANTPAQLEWLRKRLANYILACASRGEFDPDKLSTMAVRALVKRHTRTEPAHEVTATEASTNPGLVY
jgi:hypothetical protein